MSPDTYSWCLSDITVKPHLHRKHTSHQPLTLSAQFRLQECVCACVCMSVCMCVSMCV